MALYMTDYCPKHGITRFNWHQCLDCLQENLNKEEERWNNLTINEKLDELKKRLDDIEFSPKTLG